MMYLSKVTDDKKVLTFRYDLKGINANIVGEYKKHVKEMEDLKSFTQLANADLLPSLLKLQKIQERIEKLQPSYVVYRGFRRPGGFQETLGLPEVKDSKDPNFAVGKSYEFVVKRPISWTTNLSVARSFGPIRVRSEFHTRKQSLLVLTNNLMHAAWYDEMRTTETQGEVIVLPSSKISFTIMENAMTDSWIGRVFE